MSDIKVGDLVYVARPRSCCGQTTSGNGSIYQVFEMGLSDSWHCPSCGVFNDKILLARAAHHKGWGYEAYRLRRIPPLEELESTEHKEETPA